MGTPALTELGPARVLARLREAEQAANGQVELLPGIDDATMDDWEASVPEHDWRRWQDPPEIEVIDAVSARTSNDPVLAHAGARLPDSATVADLRGVTRRTYIPVIDHPDMGLDAAFRRFHRGQILAALPWDI